MQDKILEIYSPWSGLTGPWLCLTRCLFLSHLYNHKKTMVSCQFLIDNNYTFPGENTFFPPCENFHWRENKFKCLKLYLKVVGEKVVSF